MSELLRDIFTDQACDDGSSASASASSSRVNNPVSHLVRQFIDTTRNQHFLNELEDGQHQQEGDQTYSSSTSAVSEAGFSGAEGMLPDPSVMASLTPAERHKISNRSQVMARQFFPDKGEEFIENVLKKSLNIDPGQARNSGNGANMYSFLNTGSKGKGRLNGGGVQYEDDIDMVDSNSQYLVEQDEDGEQFPEGQMDGFLDNQSIDSAYEKYLDMMRENLSITNIRSSTPEYQPEVPIQENPYVTQGNGFDIGMQLWQKGDVSKAILAFESQVHHDPQSSDAWRMLGTCHAECDDDQKSIHALIHSINADPQNLESLLDLGVGYTNELNNMRALVFLKSWIANHPSYAHLSQKTANEQDAHPEETLLNYFHFHQEVLDLFNNAVEQAPNDADLHIVLGIMHNISKSYDMAIEHFRTALEMRPDDYALWNKLGATLANSSSPKDAIHAYRKSLQLKPNYIRAWINLGIAYANMKRHEEAVKFYLRALSMSLRSESVWQYLGMAFTCMGRKDLVQLCKHKDIERFRDFFVF